MRVESSIITSLSELRAIEQQRISDERAALERRRLAEIEAVRAAEQARVEAEEAKRRAEREALVRIETARAEAEREARMRVEAAEASERARLAAQLEERRLSEELELRRVEVARKRPTWMVAVTITAAFAAAVLSWFAIDRSQRMHDAQATSARANHDREVAAEELRQTQARLAGLQTDVEAIDARIGKLNRQLMDAQNAEERRKVQLALAAEAKAHADAQQKIADENRRKAEIERKRVVDVSKCTGTALGCMSMH